MHACPPLRPSHTPLTLPRPQEDLILSREPRREASPSPTGRVDVTKHENQPSSQRGLCCDWGAAPPKGWGSGGAGESALLMDIWCYVYCFDFGPLSVKSVKAAGTQYVGKSDPACLKLTIQSKKPLWKKKIYIYMPFLYIKVCSFFDCFLFLKGIAALSHLNLFVTSIFFCKYKILFFVLLVGTFQIAVFEIFLGLPVWRMCKTPFLGFSYRAPHHIS